MWSYAPSIPSYAQGHFFDSVDLGDYLLFFAPGSSTYYMVYFVCADFLGASCSGRGGWFLKVHPLPSASC